MRVAYIIDDEAHASENLMQKILSITKDFHQIYIFDNALTAYEAILNRKPDIIFSDIEMPDMNGIRLHEKVLHLNVPLIFVTAHVKFSLKAIKQQAFDYILKPVKEDELRDSLNRFFDFEKRVNLTAPAPLSFSEINFRQKGKILIHALEKIYIIALENIVSLKAENSYTMIQMIDGESVTASKPIKYFEDLLAESGFIRVHRSNMVNVVFVKEINTKDGDLIMMMNGSKFVASKEGKTLMINYFKNIL